MLLILTPFPARCGCLHARRQSIDNAPSSPNFDNEVEDLRTDFRIASQQLLEFRQVFWDEIQHFEEQKVR